MKSGLGQFYSRVNDVTVGCRGDPSPWRLSEGSVNDVGAARWPSSQTNFRRYVHIRGPLRGFWREPVGGAGGHGRHLRNLTAHLSAGGAASRPRQKSPALSATVVSGEKIVVWIFLLIVSFHLLKKWNGLDCEAMERRLD